MPNSGEVTEDYATYAKHLLTAGFVGFFFGAIATILGYSTTFYQRVGSGLLGFTIANPLPALLLFGVITGASYFFLRSKFKNNNKEKKK